jgi:hypothetical protein
MEPQDSERQRRLAESVMQRSARIAEIEARDCCKEHVQTSLFREERHGVQDGEVRITASYLDVEAS